MSCECCKTDEFKVPVCSLTTLSDSGPSANETFSFDFSTGGFLDGTYILEDDSSGSMAGPGAAFMVSPNLICHITGFRGFPSFAPFDCTYTPPYPYTLLPDVGDNNDCTKVSCSIHAGAPCPSLSFGNSPEVHSGNSISWYEVVLGRGATDPCCNGLGITIRAYLVTYISGVGVLRANLTASYYAPWPGSTIIRDTITLYLGQQPHLQTLYSSIDSYIGIPSVIKMLNDYNNLPDSILLTKV
jgi:hypothetical protein